MTKRFLGALEIKVQAHLYEGPDGVVITVNKEAEIMKQRLGDKLKIELNEFEGFSTMITSFTTIAEARRFLDASGKEAAA